MSQGIIGEYFDWEQHQSFLFTGLTGNLFTATTLYS